MAVVPNVFTKSWMTESLDKWVRDANRFDRWGGAAAFSATFVQRDDPVATVLFGGPEDSHLSGNGE